MRGWQVAVRNGLRRLGLTGPLTHLVQWRHMQRYRRFRREYERTRPTKCSVTTGPYTFDLSIRNADEYCRFSAFYEAPVIDALLSGARPGEVVWDIGANVGLYTMMLARAVTPGGRVYAFEPAPDSAGRIVEHTTANGVENYELFNMALGRERGSLLLSDPEPFSPVRRLLDPGERAEAGVIEVAVETGDDLRASRGLPVPALVKIDVEGAEEGVMLGMRKTLADPACRTLVCEVHFSILAERGDSQAWQRIEQLLRSCGFDQQRWIAQSHLAAQKSAPDGRSNGQQPA